MSYMRFQIPSTSGGRRQIEVAFKVPGAVELSFVQYVHGDQSNDPVYSWALCADWLRELPDYDGFVHREMPSDDPEAKAAYNAIESLLLSHFAAGVNVLDPAYREGLATCLEKLANTYQE